MNHPAPGTKPTPSKIVHFRWSENVEYPAEVAVVDVNPNDPQMVDLYIYARREEGGRIRRKNVTEGIEIGQWHYPDDPSLHAAEIPKN